MSTLFVRLVNDGGNILQLAASGSKSSSSSHSASKSESSSFGASEMMACNEKENGGLLASPSGLGLSFAAGQADGNDFSMI